MSSRRKDARWQCAYNMAATLNLDFEDFTGTGWAKLLVMAENFMIQAPDMEEVLYRQYVKRVAEE